MRLAHVSDTHFGTERPAVLAALLATLEDLQPQVVILSGDITQRARRSQFEAARRFVDALPRNAHRVVVPGNHDIPVFDIWRRFTRPYLEYQRSFGARESLWHADGVALLALDATHPIHHSLGRLPTPHLQERLQAARATGTADCLLVVAHQPLWTAWGEDKRQTLIGRHETARVLADARVDIVFSGHVHVPFIGNTATSDPHLAWRFVLCGAGTAVSHRTRAGAPNSFNLLELDPSSATLRAVRYDWDGAEFVARPPLVFRREATGWEPAQ